MKVKNGRKSANEQYVSVEKYKNLAITVISGNSCRSTNGIYIAIRIFQDILPFCCLFVVLTISGLEIKELKLF